MTKVLKIICGMFAVASVLLVGVVVRLSLDNGGLERQNAQIERYKTQLENVYEKSFFELSDSVRNMENSLYKLTVANTAARQQLIIADIIGQTETAQSDAGALPLAEGSLRQTAAFANKTGDFCKYLNRKLANGGVMSAQDRQNVKNLAAASQKINAKLSGMCGKECGFDLTSGVLNNGAVQGLSEGFDEMNGDGTFEYPQLIYDGPFSDARDESIKIDEKELTAGQAQDKVMQDLALLNPDGITFKGEMQNKIPVYNFDVALKDGRVLFVQATKNGGIISQISSLGGGAPLDKNEAMLRAGQFAKALGFDAQPIWVSQTEGMTYVNLAPVQNGVIIYPDLVKVAIDGNGIVGFESYNYLANHKQRKITSPKGAPQDMEGRLCPELIVKHRAVALIPQGNGEKLCYEYECEADGNQYFVYLNASTGEEEDIFKVIAGTEGHTVA